MIQPTFRDLVQFVLEHRTDKSFVGCTEYGISLQLHEGLKAGTMLYSQDDEGKINGMILAEIRPAEGVLFVTENLAMSKANLCKFAAIARQRWPELRLEWLKRGIHKIHNTERIYKKFGAL